MKKFSMLLLFLIAGLNFSFSQDIIPSSIKEVTLFSNQALINRTSVLDVTQGLNELFIEINAFSLDKDSVQAVVYGEGEVYSVQFKEVYLKDAPQENIKQLIEKIQKMKDERESLINKNNVLGKKKEFLNSLVDFSKTQLPADLKTNFPEIESLEKTLSFLNDSYSGINKDSETIAFKIREVNRGIEVLEQELASLKRPAKKTRKIIEIVFNSAKKQRVKIEASYLVYGAFWSPIYKVNTGLELKDIDLTMFSKIQQKTGENWENVELSISNVIPMRGERIPLLDSWILDVVRYTPKRKGVSAFSGAMKEMDQASVTEYPEGDFLEEKEARFISAQKSKFPLSFEYKLPQPISIESKEKETILPLFSKELKGDFFYHVAPKISSLPFLVCEIKGDKELLAGLLNVYFGGRFIGKTRLEEKNPGEKFKVNLGADREIKVKREKTKDNVKETFFKKIERQTIVRELAFKITVENLKDKKIDIEVLDSIPVSRTDKVEVKDVKITPRPAEKDLLDKEGVNLWKLSINPKEKKEIEISFTVIYPKDTPLRGL